MAGTDRTLHNVLTNLPHILSKQFSNKILRKKIPFPSGKIQNWWKYIAIFMKKKIVLEFFEIGHFPSQVRT